MQSVIEKKINKKDYQVLTPNGWSQFSGVRRIKNSLYNVKLENSETQVTHDHPFSILINGKETTSRLSDLNIGDRLQTKNGFESILEITPLNKKEWTYDLLDVEKDSMYYANDIVSHNCFLETGHSAIDGDLLSKFRENSKKPILSLMDGHYSIWEKPDPDHIYAVGVDVGEGVGQAASVAQILDLTDLTDIRQVAEYHNNEIDPFHFGTVLNEIAHQWGRPWLLIERNNCGGTVIDSLTEVHHYENIVNYTPENQAYYSKLGVYSHTNAKYRGVMNMRYWMNGLQSVSIYDIATIQELETFIKYPNGTWKKQKGDYIFDDRVMSLMWCLFMLEPEICERYFEIADWDSNGKPARLNQINITPPEYFKLDPFFQTEPDAPLPAFIGASPGLPEDDIEELYKQGWSFPDNNQIHDTVF